MWAKEEEKVFKEEEEVFKEEEVSSHTSHTSHNSTHNPTTHPTSPTNPLGFFTPPWWWKQPATAKRRTLRPCTGTTRTFPPPTETP